MDRRTAILINRYIDMKMLPISIFPPEKKKQKADVNEKVLSNDTESQIEER